MNSTFAAFSRQRSKLRAPSVAAVIKAEKSTTKKITENDKIKSKVYLPLRAGTKASSMVLQRKFTFSFFKKNKIKPGFFLPVPQLRPSVPHHRLRPLQEGPRDGAGRRFLEIFYFSFKKIMAIGNSPSSEAAAAVANSIEYMAPADPPMLSSATRLNRERAEEALEI